ncbi:MAG: DNA-3-methyladenine glycosylase 2 family protein [Oscillospiraceae bacterium]|nr:DNA-3-methyladenine glycosylase 2 family protein [Oscillospiraceae bacterium]
MEYVFETKEYSLARTLQCGQCFRFHETEDGGFAGVANGCCLQLWQRGDTVTVRCDAPSEDMRWLGSYFALTDCCSDALAALRQNETLAEMLRLCGGIRIMRQPFWEVLCSFIISQNNNIPRISAIVERLCTLFGEQKNGCFAFPAPERVAQLSAEDLAPLRCGYRAPYIIDAAQKLASGEITEETVRSLPTDEARKELLKIKGVGPKVADCVLLFGAGHTDAFPQDVWIKRAMAQYFPDGLPVCAAPYAGLAQQYIFHYARTQGKFT